MYAKKKAYENIILYYFLCLIIHQCLSLFVFKIQSKGSIKQLDFSGQDKHSAPLRQNDSIGMDESKLLQLQRIDHAQLSI